MIDFKDIYFIRDGKFILKNINLHIEEDLFILGPNGSGKSTLISLLKAYNLPSRGNLYVFSKKFGRDNWSLVKKDIRIVSSVLNKFRASLSKKSVFDIVLSGLSGSIGISQIPSEDEKDKVYDFLKGFDFYHKKDEIYKNLSQGEAQKTMVLRALIGNPKILILYEPCLGLDIREKTKLLRFLKDLDSNLIYISHDISEMLKRFKHLAMLKDGEIFLEGRREDILSSDNLSRLFDMDLRLLSNKDESLMIEVL